MNIIQFDIGDWSKDGHGMSDSFNMKESLSVSCPLSTFSSTLAQANALIVLLKWKRWSPFMDSCSPDFVSNTVTPTRHPCFSKS